MVALSSQRAEQAPNLLGVRLGACTDYVTERNRWGTAPFAFSALLHYVLLRPEINSVDHLARKVICLSQYIPRREYILNATLTCMNTRKTHLTPTVVTDKNGKTTTVHKRPPVEAKASRLPAPSMQAASSQPASLERVLTIIAKKQEDRDLEAVVRLHGLLANPETGEADLNGQTLLARFNNRQTDVVIKALETQKDFLPILRIVYGVYSIDQAAGFAAVYEPDLFVQPSQANAPLVQRVRINHETLGAASPHLRNNKLLGEQHADYYKDLSRYSDEELAPVKSFLRLYGAMAALGRKGNPPKELIEFALHGGHDIKNIVAAIGEKGITDPVALRGVLEGAAAPVAEGWL